MYPKGNGARDQKIILMKYSGTKLFNEIARSKIDLPNVFFKNVQSAFV